MQSTAHDFKANVGKALTMLPFRHAERSEASSRAKRGDCRRAANLARARSFAALRMTENSAEAEA